MIESKKRIRLSPRVSIIMPVRNGKEYIDEAIASVIEQGFEDFELVVIDDGSDDDDYFRLEEIDSRIVVHRTLGGGVSFARNHGYAASTGEYVCFLDADDVIAPGKLECQVGFLDRNPSFGFVYGHFSTWRADVSGDFPTRGSLLSDCSQVDKLVEKKTGWIYDSLICEEQIHVNTAMIRRSVIELAGLFDEKMKIAEDQEWIIRLSRTTKMACLDAYLSLYRVHAQSTMRKNLREKNYDVEVRQNAMKLYGGMTPDKRLVSVDRYTNCLNKFHFDHGVEHFRANSYRIAFFSFFYPLKNKYRLARSLTYFVLSAILMPFNELTRKKN